MFITNCFTGNQEPEAMDRTGFEEHPSCLKLKEESGQYRGGAWHLYAFDEWYIKMIPLVVGGGILVPSLSSVGHKLRR